MKSSVWRYHSQRDHIGAGADDTKSDKDTNGRLNDSRIEQTQYTKRAKQYPNA